MQSRICRTILHDGRDQPGCERWVGLAVKNITTVQSCKSTFFPGVDLSRRSGRHNKSRRASFQISCAGAVHLIWWSRKCPSLCSSVSVPVSPPSALLTAERAAPSYYCLPPPPPLPPSTLRCVISLAGNRGGLTLQNEAAPLLSAGLGQPLPGSGRGGHDPVDNSGCRRDVSPGDRD